MLLLSSGMSLQTPVKSLQPVPRPRVLVVDDSIIARRMVRFALEGVVCDIDEAEDGAQAWELLQQQEFSLLITDLRMPRVDGLELIRRLREQPHSVDLPIILLTGDTDPVKERIARQSGVSLFIRKPFQPEQLAGLVRQVIA